MNNITPIRIHKLAGIVPMASDEEQRALNMNIAANGYNSELGDILLYNGQIIDGRCRQVALIKADEDPRHYAKEVECKSYQEVAALVQSVNTRRNLTITQKAISAYRMWTDNQDITQELAAKSWGIGTRTIKNVSTIVKYIEVIEKSPLVNIVLIHKFQKGTSALIPIQMGEILDVLFNGYLIRVHDEMKPTDAIKTIAQNIKNLAETLQPNRLEIDTHEWSADGLVKSEKGKEVYYGLVGDTEMCIDTKITIMNLINTVYPSSEEKAIVIPLALIESIQEQIIAYAGTE